MVDSEPSSPKSQWSPELCSWVSLAIFIHLFALFVAVTTYTRPSGLQDQLHNLFGLYLRNLHLTAYPVSYPFARFYLTHALPSDVDFACEIEVASSGGVAETVSIPRPELQPLVRRRRYQALANATGSLAAGESNEEFSSILPKAVAGSILKQRGASEGIFRCRAHYLPEIEALAESEPKRRAALENYRTVYEAQVFVGPAGVELLKKSTTLEVAPVQSAPKRPGASQP